MKQHKILLVTAISLILLSSIAYAGVTGIDWINIKVLSDSKFDYEGKMWLVEWASGDTDKISGYISPSDFKSETGEKSKTNFYIKMMSTDEYATYNFQPVAAYHAVQKVNLIDKKFYLKSLDEVKQWAEENCVDFDYDGEVNGIITGAPPLYSHAWCVNWGKKLGTVTGIGNKREVFKTHWEFQAGDKTKETFTLTNANNIKSGSSTRVDNILIQWQGNLETGYDAPEPINVLGFYSSDTGWRIIDENNYETWDYYVKNTLHRCLNDWAHGETKGEYCENDANTKADYAIKKTTNADFSAPTIIDTSFSSGKFKIDLAESITIPTFRLFIDADYLELVIETGAPKIVTCPDIKFGQNSIGKFSPKVMNIGGYEGSFSGRIYDCSADIDPVGLIQKFTLNSKETKELTYLFSGKGDVKGSCKFELKEEFTQQTDTCTFDVEIIKEQECTPGATWVVKEDDIWVVRKCNPDGLSSTIILTCEKDEIAKLVEGDWTCVKKDEEDCAKEGEGCWFKECCEDLICQGLIFKKCVKEKSELQKLLEQLLPYIILISLGALVAYAIKKEVVWAGIGAIIGLIGALIVSWIMANPLTAFLAGLGIWIVIAVVGAFIGMVTAILSGIAKKVK